MIQKMSLNLKKCKELYTHLFTALLRVEFFPLMGDILTHNRAAQALCEALGASVQSTCSARGRFPRKARAGRGFL
jgi:hypothetical protein